MPVIYDVRWCGAQRLAFLGKNENQYQQLFFVDTLTEKITAMTKADQYVTAYDVRGDTIAYSTLVVRQRAPGFDEDFIACRWEDRSAAHLSRRAINWRHSGKLSANLSEYIAPPTCGKGSVR